MSPSDKTWHIVPPEEMRCVWMTAGIISYQLCDREFDCEHCPLDAAIRNHMPRTATAPDEENGKGCSPDRERLRDGRLYSRNHCWTEQISAGIVRIGVEPFLSEALLSPKAIVFPSAGQLVHRGQTSLWIVMEGGTLPIESPLDGVVRGTNHRLASRPHLISLQPFGGGWLFELAAEDSSLQEAGLMNRDEAETRYGADQAGFLASLRAAASSPRHPSVGVTLADGGQRLHNIAEILGPGKYFALLKKAFC